MKESQTALDVPYLQRLLARRDHELFLAALENTAAPRDDFLQALGGEGLYLLLSESGTPNPVWAGRYAKLVLSRRIVAPKSAISRLATHLNSAELFEWMKQENNKSSVPRFPNSAKRLGEPTSPSSRQAMLQVRRVVQIMQMFLGDGQYSDAGGICRSVFRSQQERTFLRALSLRFPGLQALPNYPLDQIVELERVSAMDAETLRYGRNCRLDAVLIVPDEGDPVAVFELDSRFHDQSERSSRDEMKNSLIAATGLPFFRLRAESPESMTTDEWYALLSEQVLPHIDLGSRIRCRQAAYSLIPC